jgi:hypothetical protein
MVRSEQSSAAVAEGIESQTGLAQHHLGTLLAAVVGCLLLFLGADRIARGVVAVQSPVEAMYGESILYDQAARLIHGEALYQALDRPPFTVAAYTPLYYALVAPLQRLDAPPFLPGRVLSMGAGLVATILAGWVAVRRTGDWRAGPFAGLLFVAFGFPGDFPWFALYKEDLLGVALSLGALAVLETGSDRRRALSAGALAGLAFLTKQTLFAVSVAGFVWLCFRNRQSAVVFAAAAGIVGIGPCVLLALSDPAFLDNTIRANVNPTGIAILRANLDTLVRFQGAIVVLALLPLLSGALPWRRWLDDPLVLFWLFSALLLPVGLSKVGSNTNYWIDWAAVSAVLCTSSVWMLVIGNGGLPVARVLAAVGLVAVLVSPAWLPPPVLNLQTVLDRAQQPDERQALEFAQVLERVRREPRGVYSEPLDIVVLAGREILLEPFIFSILNLEGQWDARPAIRQVCSGQIGLLVLDHPLEGPDWQTQDYLHWPSAVLQALRATMRLERQQARLFLYVPIEGTPAGWWQTHGTAAPGIACPCAGSSSPSDAGVPGC